MYVEKESKIVNAINKTLDPMINFFGSPKAYDCIGMGVISKTVDGVQAMVSSLNKKVRRA